MRYSVKIWSIYVGQRWQYNTAHARFVLDKLGIQTHSECVTLIGFPRQPYLIERPQLYVSMCIASVVDLRTK